MTQRALKRSAPALVLGLLVVPAAWFVARGAPPEPATPDAAATEQGAAPAQAGAAAPPVQLSQVMEEQLEAQHEAKASQTRIDELDDQTDALLTKFQQATDETESIEVYIEQLEVQIQSQREEMDSIQRQMDQVESFSRDILPMMQLMLDKLGEFVELDVPFLLEERRNRVAALRELMTRADVTISEKYRRILEAYQVEMEYGRTLEGYEGRLGEGDEARTVNFLRIGRVGLMYQTLDGRETGYWDGDARSWTVDAGYRQEFKEGWRVAKKLGAPDLLIAPVPSPKEGQS